MEVLRFDEVGCGKDLKKVHKLLHKERGCEEYMLLMGEQFELRLFKVRGKEVKVFTEGKLQVLTCVRGQVKLKSESNTNNAELSLAPVETVLVPACVERFEMSGDGVVVCANYSHYSNKLQLINHEISRD